MATEIRSRSSCASSVSGAAKPKKSSTGTCRTHARATERGMGDGKCRRPSGACLSFPCRLLGGHGERRRLLGRSHGPCRGLGLALLEEVDKAGGDCRCRCEGEEPRDDAAGLLLDDAETKRRHEATEVAQGVDDGNGRREDEGVQA